MRMALQIKSEKNGILVGKISPLSDANKHLKMHDVVLAVDGIIVAISYLSPPPRDSLE